MLMSLGTCNPLQTGNFSSNNTIVERTRSRKVIHSSNEGMHMEIMIGLITPLRLHLPWCQRWWNLNWTRPNGKRKSATNEPYKPLSVRGGCWGEGKILRRKRLMFTYRLGSKTLNLSLGVGNGEVGNNAGTIAKGVALFWPHFLGE